MRQQVPFRSLTHALKAIIGIAALLAVLVLSGCGASTGIPTTPHDKLAALCEENTHRDSDYCGCVADAVIASGYDTDAEVDQIEALTQTVAKSGSVSGLPAPVLSALNSCSASSS